jgi:LacI family transcriptional regulator
LPDVDPAAEGVGRVMTTMRDVAAAAGVSAKTVSRVFNDDPHVTPETRARVESALAQLNYVPNAVATAFRTGRSAVIGIAVPDIVDPFFAAIAKAVNQLAAHHGMSTVVTSLGDDPHDEAATVGRLLSQALSGLIIAPVATEHTYLEVWKDRLPIAFVDRAPVKLTVDAFTEDDVGGGHLATQHLIEHGHRRVALIGDTSEVATTRNRMLGYRAALTAAGIEHEPDYEVFGVVDRESAERVVRKLGELDHPPTAIMSSNARSSMALIPALRDRPFAVVGFGDFPMADMLHPALTVIDQDPYALGTLAAQRVFDRLAHPKRRYRRRTVLPVTLIERESCLPPG